MALLKIRVTPGARDDAIAGWQGDSLRIKVRARPEKGRANQAALALLARSLDLPPSRLSVVRGVTSRDKIVQADGFTDEDIQAKLATLL